MPSAATPRGMIVTLCTGSARGVENATRACPISWCATMSRSVSDRTRLRRSSPATTRSMASSRSACSTASLPLRAARRAASFRMLARSAPAKPGGPPRDDLEAHLRREPDVARVYPQDRLAAADVRPVDDDLPVEPPGAEQRRIQDLGSVRGRHDDDALGRVEAVHLDQELVQRLLALVVPPDEPGRPRAALADPVGLVD